MERQTDREGERERRRERGRDRQGEREAEREVGETVRGGTDRQAGRQTDGEQERGWGALLITKSHSTINVDG